MNRLRLRPNALLELRELLNPATLLALQGCVPRSGVCAREGPRTGVYRSGVEFIFDAQELGVLVHALAASRGTGFDLAGERVNKNNQLLRIEEDRKSTRLNSSHVASSS